ncbi:MAG TPA: hypothetical protein VF442_01965 [Sphingobium sp.]
MARYEYVILSRGKAGRDQEFRDWYDAQHLGDVARVDGVVSARRLNIGYQKVYDIDVPQYTSMTIYELETDDPEALVAKLSAMAGSDAMPMSDAVEKSGMLQVIASLPEKG